MMMIMMMMDDPKIEDAETEPIYKHHLCRCVYNTVDLFIHLFGMKMRFGARI